MTLSKEDSHFSDAPKSKLKPLQKKLKIVFKPYNGSYTLGLNLKGKYFEKYGYKWHDEVRATITENQILIEKIINND
jgi:hypothetical protein